MSKFNSIKEREFSSWEWEEVQSWLIANNLQNFIEKFQRLEINGYDLCCLSNEDLNEIKLENFHERNKILKIVRMMTIDQLKIEINYEDRSFVVQLEFDPQYTVENLVAILLDLLKISNSMVYITTYDNEILLPNIKLVDLIFINPKKYKKLKVISGLSGLVQGSSTQAVPSYNYKQEDKSYSAKSYTDDINKNKFNYRVYEETVNPIKESLNTLEGFNSLEGGDKKYANDFDNKFSKLPKQYDNYIDSSSHQIPIEENNYNLDFKYYDKEKVGKVKTPTNEPSTGKDSLNSNYESKKNYMNEIPKASVKTKYTPSFEDENTFKPKPRLNYENELEKFDNANNLGDREFNQINKIKKEDSQISQEPTAKYNYSDRIKDESSKGRYSSEKRVYRNQISNKTEDKSEEFDRYENYAEKYKMKFNHEDFDSGNYDNTPKDIANINISDIKNKINSIRSQVNTTTQAHTPYVRKDLEQNKMRDQKNINENDAILNKRPEMKKQPIYNMQKN